MKRLGTFLAKAVTLVISVGVLAAAAPPAGGAYVEITYLESQRSLGDGVLAQYLASADAALAARAALAIGRTKRSAGEAMVAGCVHDARTGVRAMCVYALGLLATTGTHAAAIVGALDDPQGAVRVAALDAVARYEAARRFAGAAENAAQGAVERALLRDADPVVRARAATALVEFREGTSVAQAADTLSIAFRTDRAPIVRWHAMWTIYRGFATATSRGLVEGALRDRDELVRIEAVRAMSRYKDRTLVPIVRPLLRDASWRVQEQSAETIRVLQGKPLTDHWKAIPAYVHLPALQPDPLAALPALARPARSGRLAAPPAAAAILEPHADPSTVARITGPAPGAHPRVRIVTTKGNLYLVLYPEWAPLTVANFLNLAARGYYDGNRWFRIVPDFVVQTGDPNDNGEGDAGYSIGAEENPLEQRSYVISMGMNYDSKTNTPIRDSAGTQYYVTLSPQLHLDRDFTVFGSTVGGTDVLAHLVESDRVVRIDRIADVML